MTQAPTIDNAAVDQLAQGFSGRILRDGDDGYDAARSIFNAMIDRRPAVIAQPANAADVSAAVKFAAQHELLVSVKGGGHAASGHAVAEGGLMIDLALLNEIKVDAQAKTERAQDCQLRRGVGAIEVVGWIHLRVPAVARVRDCLGANQDPPSIRRRSYREDDGI